jgi:hypothetical protein
MAHKGALAVAVHTGIGHAGWPTGPPPRRSCWSWMASCRSPWTASARPFIGGTQVPAGSELRVDAGAEGASAWVTTTPGLEAVTADGGRISPPWAA